MSRSTFHSLFITALLALMVTACTAIPAESQAVDARKAQYEKAKAVFDERCKTAGMKIYKTVEDVEGVFFGGCEANGPQHSI